MVVVVICVIIVVHIVVVVIPVVDPGNLLLKLGKEGFWEYLQQKTKTKKNNISYVIDSIFVQECFWVKQKQNQQQNQQ